MEIVHIAAEMAPFAKEGGLADVMLGLCRELNRQKKNVTAILPKYDSGDYSCIDGLRQLSTIETQWFPIEAWEGVLQGVRVVLIDPRHSHHYFNRGCVYGESDDVDRYLAFCRASLEWLARGIPDVIHLHDWQTAACAPLARDGFGCFEKTRLIMTIHNIAYQGHCSPEHLNRIGLNGDSYKEMDRLADNYDPQVLNLMKGGIVYSDVVTTVSPKYAQEVLAPEGGKGLESTLQRHGHKFTGVLNGLDEENWNPRVDQMLPRTFKDAVGKAEVKARLREEIGLSQEETPIVAVVSRLVPQKGIELIKHSLHHTLHRGGQFILLGSSPIAEIQNEFSHLQWELRDNPNCSIILKYDEGLAHRIYAGADMLLVPSLFEPCGLTQLIAMRYGTVPVVRETGGLADTVFDVDYGEKPYEESNGYSFRDPDFGGVDSALDRALSCWRNEKGTWAHLMRNGMNHDSSWERSARDYLSLYGGGE